MSDDLAYRRWRARAYVLFWSWDFAIGIVVLVTMFFVVDAGTLKSGQVGLGIAATVGLGVLAGTLAATQLLTALLDEHYRRILEQTPGGVPNAMLPYRTLAVLAGLTAGVSAVCALGWSGFSAGLQQAAVVVAAWLATWTLVGAVQVVFLSSWHGVQRARLLQVVGDARQELRRRQGERRSHQGRP